MKRIIAVATVFFCVSFLLAGCREVRGAAGIMICPPPSASISQYPVQLLSTVCKICIIARSDVPHGVHLSEQ